MTTIDLIPEMTVQTKKPLTWLEKLVNKAQNPRRGTPLISEQERAREDQLADARARAYAQVEHLNR